jgi:hypothetical protein
MTTDRRDYHREYQRKRRETARDGPARSYVKGGDSEHRRADGDTWLARLRTLYPPFLRAQHGANAFRDDTLRLTGIDPALPAHVAADLAEAEAALDAHIALDPDRAAEYFERHAIEDQRRRLYRLERAQVTEHKPRGRPRLTPAATRATLTHAEQAARATRETAYAAQTLALDGPILSTRAATRIQKAWERARTRHERAAETLAQHDALTARQTAERDTRDRDTLDRAEQIQAMHADITTRLAALPDPPRAPLYTARAHPDAPDVVAARRAAAAARAAPVPLTGERYAELSARYNARTDAHGATHLIRISTGKRVRVNTVRLFDQRRVRTLDLIDALRPCGLI